MSEIDKIRKLEGAIVDLVSAIQKGDWAPEEEMLAVKEAVQNYPNWRVEIQPLEEGERGKIQKVPDYIAEPPESYYAEECPYYLPFRAGLHKECINCRNCKDGKCIHPDALFYEEACDQ